jgi:hypothetical protein
MSKKSKKCLYKQTASKYRVVLLILEDRIYKNMTYEQASYCFDNCKTPAIFCTISKDLETNVKFLIPLSPNREEILLKMKERLDRVLLKYYAMRFEIGKVEMEVYKT